MKKRKRRRRKTFTLMYWDYSYWYYQYISFMHYSLLLSPGESLSFKWSSSKSLILIQYELGYVCSFQKVWPFLIGWTWSYLGNSSRARTSANVITCYTLAHLSCSTDLYMQSVIHQSKLCVVVFNKIHICFHIQISQSNALLTSYQAEQCAIHTLCGVYININVCENDKKYSKSKSRTTVRHFCFCQTLTHMCISHSVLFTE